MTTLEIIPEIKTVQIGRRTLTDLEILPISIGSLVEMGDILEKGILDFKISSDSSNVEIGLIVKDLIKNNLEGLLKHIVSEEQDTKKLLREITIPQGISIAEIVYEDNWSAAEKKLQESALRKSLKRDKKSTPLNPSSAQSPESMESPSTV